MSIPDNPISNILRRATEPSDYAPAHLRNTDNVRRIAEFITKLTWREITTIATAVEKNEQDLAKALVEWAEKLLGEQP